MGALEVKNFDCIRIKDARKVKWSFVIGIIFHCVTVCSVGTREKWWAQEGARRKGRESKRNEKGRGIWSGVEGRLGWAGLGWAETEIDSVRIRCCCRRLLLSWESLLIKAAAVGVSERAKAEKEKEKSESRKRKGKRRRGESEWVSRSDLKFVNCWELDEWRGYRRRCLVSGAVTPLLCLCRISHHSLNQLFLYI